MFKAIAIGFTRFFFDADYFNSKWDKWVAKVRGTLMMVGAAIAIPGTGFGERIESVVSTAWRPWVGLGLMGLSLMLRAGQMNQKQENKP